MRRLVVAVCLVVVAVGVVPMLASAQVNASVTGVTVSPDGPAPGETVTFTVTVRNLQNSGDPLRINAIALRNPSTQAGIEEYERVRSVGTLAPGATIEVPLTLQLERTGTRDLRVYVYGENANSGEDVQLRYPVTVDVAERHPQLEVQPDDPVAGVESNGTVTVANGLGTDISNVELTVSGDGVTMLERRSVFASVADGETVTAPFRYRPTGNGSHRLTATLSYTLPNGTDRTATLNRTIEPESLEESVVVEARGRGGGTEQSIAVDVLNRGNAPAEDLVVTASSANATVDRAIVGTVGAGDTEQVRLNTTLSGSPADVTVSANYDLGAGERSAETTTTLYSAPATIELTGLSVDRAGGRLRITGSTGNVGTTAARSVIVRVVPTERVEPVSPNRDFFIGEVPASDFSSFDLTARTEGNVSAIPVEVSYLVDGSRQTQRFEVSVPGIATQPPEADSGGGGPGAGLLGALGLGVVAVLVVAGVLVRRYRRGDIEL